MNEAATAVIKNNEVHMAGKVRLGEVTGRPAQPAPAAGAPRPQHGAGPAVRIARTAEDHVIIEVTCGCGTKTMVRCNF